uniref:Uncharacterized protein n=1 Tax=Alexandrium catenella TaxID=2925 RepID=A0A7S1RY74_ALECA|mmetsp:Transcript_78067/g.207169  ORF Transcript_78067/g.207169 Transcript_78067/m.207169 type:complete len:201 (+) Transcript_78067:459-1061(+)
MLLGGRELTSHRSLNRYFSHGLSCNSGEIPIDISLNGFFSTDWGPNGFFSKGVPLREKETLITIGQKGFFSRGALLKESEISSTRGLNGFFSRDAIIEHRLQLLQELLRERACDIPRVSKSGVELVQLLLHGGVDDVPAMRGARRRRRQAVVVRIQLEAHAPEGAAMKLGQHGSRVHGARGEGQGKGEGSSAGRGQSRPP